MKKSLLLCALLGSLALTACDRPNPPQDVTVSVPPAPAPATPAAPDTTSTTVVTVPVPGPPGPPGPQGDPGRTGNTTVIVPAPADRPNQN
jgi:hypothetical protein